MQTFDNTKHLCIKNRVCDEISIPPTITSLALDCCTIPRIVAIDSLERLVITNHNCEFDLYLPPQLKHLVLTNCKPVFKTELPNSLVLLMVSRCPTPLPPLTQLLQLEDFHYNDTDIAEFPTLPPNVINVYLRDLRGLHGDLSLPKEMAKVQSLTCIRCQIVDLPLNMQSLVTLRCSELPLEYTPSKGAFPESLRHLYMNDCQLRALPSLPKLLEKCEVHINHLEELPDIPASLKSLDICSNPIKYYPYVYNQPPGFKVLFDLNQFSAAFEFSTFRVNGVKVFSPLHLVAELDAWTKELDHETVLYVSDMFDDEDAYKLNELRLHIICEIQKQVQCKEFMNVIKEELIAHTWHPSRIETWCGVDFSSEDD